MRVRVRVCVLRGRPLHHLRFGRSPAARGMCVSPPRLRSARRCRPGEPKLLQPTSYLEYGTRSLRGRLQQPPPKAPKGEPKAKMLQPANFDYEYYRVVVTNATEQRDVGLTPGLPVILERACFMRPARLRRRPPGSGDANGTPEGGNCWRTCAGGEAHRWQGHEKNPSKIHSEDSPTYRSVPELEIALSPPT